jgi:hypothetical protein
MAMNSYADYIYFNDAEDVEECQKLIECLHIMRARLCKSQARMLLESYRQHMLRPAVAKDAERIVLEECASHHKRQSHTLTMSTSLRKEHLLRARELKASAERLRKEVNQLTFRAHKAQDIMRFFM